MICLLKIVAIVPHVKITEPLCPIETKDPTILRFSHQESKYEYEIPTGFIVNGSRIISKIDCDFELKHHPKIEEFIEFAYQKGLEANLYPSKASLKEIIKEKIRTSYYVHLAINTIPESLDQKKLENLTLWILLLFAFDNVIDNPKGKLPHEKNALKAYVTVLQNTLKGQGPGEEAVERQLRTLLNTSDDEDEIELALKPIRMAQMMTIRERSFFSETKRYLESSLTEMEQGVGMALPDYMMTRETSGAIDTVVRLAEGNIPEYFSNNVNFQRMNRLIVIYIWAVNDIGGAKEWKGHEPAYLKIQTKAYYQNLKSLHESGDETEILIESFNKAFHNLITLINESHKQYFNFKELVLNSISDGSIFSDTQTEDIYNAMPSGEQESFKEMVRLDFLRRCEIRENLSAAANECTKTSSRYFDPVNPEKNIELTSFTRGYYDGDESSRV